jgi:PKHD-type hydroxylase
MIWLLDNVLDSADIRVLTQDWRDDIFHCGSDSNPNKKVKKTYTLNYDYAEHDTKCSYFYNKLRPHMDDYLIRRVGQPYFVWYKTGCFYNYHLDAFPIAGVAPHFSFTCFLNGPSEYEGGELLLNVGDTVTSHKPKAGSVILYHTGLWHKVNKVLSGERKVIVGWAESIIKNSHIRDCVINMKRALNEIEDDVSVDKLEKLESVRMNLIREYADV